MPDRWSSGFLTYGTLECSGLRHSNAMPNAMPRSHIFYRPRRPYQRLPVACGYPRAIGVFPVTSISSKHTPLFEGDGSNNITFPNLR